jgi:hypothetical protein
MPRKPSQAIYEVSVYNLGSSDDTIRTKMAVMNFDPSSDRFTQIEDALRYRFAVIGSYTVHLMTPREIKKLDEEADDGIFAQTALPSGVVTQFIEIGNSYWQY